MKLCRDQIAWSVPIRHVVVCVLLVAALLAPASASAQDQAIAAADGAPRAYGGVIVWPQTTPAEHTDRLAILQADQVVELPIATTVTLVVSFDFPFDIGPNGSGGVDLV